MNNEYFSFMQKLMVSQLLAWLTAIIIVLKISYQLITTEGIFKKFDNNSALDVIVNGIRYEVIPEVKLTDHTEKTTDDLISEFIESMRQEKEDRSEKANLN